MPIAKRVYWRVCLLRLHFWTYSRFQWRHARCLCLILLSTVAVSPAFSAEYGILIADLARVHKGPGEQHQIVTQLKHGQVVSRIQVRGDWTEVSFSNSPSSNEPQQGRGWIYSRQIAVDAVSQRQSRNGKSDREKVKNLKQLSSNTRHSSLGLDPVLSQAGQPVRVQLEDEQFSCGHVENERIRNCEFSVRFGLRGEPDITRAKVYCEARFLVVIRNGDPINYSLKQERVYRIKPDSTVFEMASALEAKDEFDIRKVELISRHCMVTAFGRSTNK